MIRWSDRLYVLPGVRRRNNFTHALLIETFKAVVTFEIFQVRANRPFLAELPGLGFGDLIFFQQRGDAILGHIPALAFGEGLAEMREIRAGRHSADARLACQLETP